MAQEIINRLHASVKADAQGVIIARSGEIASVVRNGVGDYSVFLSAEQGQIGRDEAVGGGGIDSADPLDGPMTCLRVDDIRWDVFTFAGGVAADLAFNFSLHRIHSGD